MESSNIVMEPRSRASVRLSVVIPNYNHGSLVGDAVRAFAQQEPAPDEIIVVDDGSTDDSLARLSALSSEFPTLRVLALEQNQGTVAALNHGLQAARGIFINFGAADDLTHPGLFKATLSALERHLEAVLACTEGLVVDLTRPGRAHARPPILPAYEEAYLGPREVAALLRFADNWLLAGTVVIRRDAIIDAGGFDPKLRSFADGLLFKQLALRHGFCFIPMVGMTWKISPSGYSRSEAADLSRSFEVMNRSIARMKADPAFPSWYPAVFERRWRFGLARIAISAQPMRKATLLQLACGPLGRFVLNLAVAFDGTFGRTLALTWFVLQERPMSLLALVRTASFRRLRFCLRAGLGDIAPRARSNSAR
ncbi:MULTISPECIES: glycosyltransferase family A protein [unclassified Bradyrhizobium]|uniref:glycosyltransferase family 2 protein n=1 Tax=unclassified Bradyrhizobium TaxID=2631580 RepID=UPI002916DB20|nr:MULTISPECIES: glycosyltransferase family A protein [unclassified Bradyrhizobium]